MDFAEFFAGFSLFLGGSKSQKLHHVFNLFDRDEEGKMGEHTLWKYIRSFLTALYAVNEVALEMNEEALFSTVDNCALDMVMR